MVGVWNIARSGTATCNSRAIRETTCVASKECPPKTKKLSCTPTCATCSTSCQIAANCIRPASAAGRTRRPVAPRFQSGAGKARRSTLPLLVTGSAGRARNRLGSMYSGSR